MDFLKLLFVSPEINPSNRKALSIPVLNPFDKYGRVFTFSWLGFMVAFLSWYAFPPLVRLLVLMKPRKRLADIEPFIVDRHNPRRPGHDPAAGRKLEYRCSPSHVRIPGNQTQ